MSTWRPTADIGMLRIRARLLARIREFFAARDVLEVETPLVSMAGTVDPNLDSLVVSGVSGRRYLHTSPEFAMKRLLAAGSGDIFQVCKAFRDGELGRFHNPEFTLLEWYRSDFDHHDLMGEVEALIAYLTPDGCGPAGYKRVRYGELFQRVTGVDPHRATSAELDAVARARGLACRSRLDRGDLLDLLFSEAVAASLPDGQLTMVFGFPACQASLARLSDASPPVAERFEVLWGALELANGFHELVDPIEQRRRLEHEAAIRADRGERGPPVDRRFLASLEHGLPACAGVALGIDRLLMRIADSPAIGNVIGFPWDRA